MVRQQRKEKDSLGGRKVPSDAYYGIQTKRAIDNFPVSGLKMQKSIIYAMAMVKKAAALANLKEKRLASKQARAIIKACDDVLKGKLDDQFPVDVFQAGAGTSENMNVNEVIANRALERLGKKKGSYDIVHPNDHVNLGQSTNDVFHSAIHIAAYQGIRGGLLPALHDLEKELGRKAKRWRKVPKSGRTHLRDAVPMMLGQEFSGYAMTIGKNIRNLESASARLLEINLGGTAIGTSVNAPRGFQTKMFKELNRQTKLGFRQSENLFEGTQSLNAIVTVSSALKVLAADLAKIANDLRLLASGPVTGLNELELPAVQPGSSIMPGKINPAVAEMLDMVAFQVIGNDTTITLCSQAGQLELNVMMPLAAYDLLNSVEILSSSIEIFSDKCVKGIKANEKRLREYVEKNPIIVTALTPYIGYAKAAEVAKQAYKEDRSVRQIVLEKKLLDEKTLNKALGLKIGRL
jgi:aspartate ammonia-lyase